MIDETMRDRIRHADILDLGFAYMAHAGLPWLAWPLPTPHESHATWLRWVVKEVAGSPVCRRTEAAAWAELRRIDNPRLADVLTTIAPPETTP